ncbi:MAG: hypothetical protein V6Z86_03960 [Hyphomicrobiales bacterium]
MARNTADACYRRHIPAWKDLSNAVFRDPVRPGEKLRHLAPREPVDKLHLPSNHDLDGLSRGVIFTSDRKNMNRKWSYLIVGHDASDALAQEKRPDRCSGVMK